MVFHGTSWSSKVLLRGPEDRRGAGTPLTVLAGTPLGAGGSSTATALRGDRAGACALATCPPVCGTAAACSSAVSSRL